MSTVAPPTFLPLGTLAQNHGTDRERLADAAKQFEAIFVRQMLASARKADFGDPLLGGQALETFKTMQDERFADIAAKSGALGIAKSIEAQLSMQLSPSRLREGQGEGVLPKSAGIGLPLQQALPQPLPQAGGEPGGSGLSGRGG